MIKRPSTIDSTIGCYICSTTCTSEDRSTWTLDSVLTASNAVSMTTSSKEVDLILLVGDM